MAERKFGTPDAHDAVARDEKTVQEAAQYDAELDEAMKEMHPRDLGSVKVSSQDERTEWEMNIQAAESGDPSLMATFFVDQKMTVEQMVQYSKKMLK